MTALNLLAPASSYGDVLTTTNQGQGLSTILKQLQDGFGNSSTVTIATNAINFSTLGGNTFQLDSIALTASATNINAICGSNPTFPQAAPLILPMLAADPGGGSAGMIYYNTTDERVRMYLQDIGWVAVRF